MIHEVIKYKLYRKSFICQPLVLNLAPGMTSNVSLNLASFVRGLLGAFGAFSGLLDPFGHVREVGSGNFI